MGGGEHPSGGALSAQGYRKPARVIAHSALRRRELARDKENGRISDRTAIGTEAATKDLRVHAEAFPAQRAFVSKQPFCAF